MSGVPVYRGPFGQAQAERLLWRAGFGPRPGEARKLAARGLGAAVRSLTRPGPEHLSGRAPTDGNGRPLAPADAYGHDHLWWLDRMLRTSRPLVERMTLVWHDWFATSNAGVGSQRLMLGQNWLFRRYALGSFSQLLVGVTTDPAMLLWLSGTQNTKWAPNENYPDQADRPRPRAGRVPGRLGGRARGAAGRPDPVRPVALRSRRRRRDVSSALREGCRSGGAPRLGPSPARPAARRRWATSRLSAE